MLKFEIYAKIKEMEKDFKANIEELKELLEFYKPQQRLEEEGKDKFPILINIIKQKQGMTQQELIEALLNNSAWDLGFAKTRQVIKLAEKKRLVIVKIGHYNTHTYYLKEPPKTVKPRPDDEKYRVKTGKKTIDEVFDSVGIPNIKPEYPEADD